MSEPQTSRPDLPIVPALVVSSLLGGLIALGLFGLWRFAMPGAANPPERVAAAPAVASPSGPAEFVEFLPPLTPQEQRIEAALEKLAECDFEDQPLTDAVAFLAEYTSITMIIDVEALTEEGIATDTPVTRKLSGLKLRSLLNLMLTPLQLAAIPREEVLLVTTLHKAKERRLTRTYPVSDLCYSSAYKAFDFQSLMTLLEQETSGPWQNRDGEGGDMVEFENTGSLSIQQSYKVHREILDLLRSLRAVQKSNLHNASKSELQKWDEQRAAAASALLKRPAAPAEFVDVIQTSRSESERHIEQSLDKSLSLSFQNTPLWEVTASFAKQLSINVVIDNEALTEEGIATDTPVTLQLHQITGRSALELLLRPLQLSAVVDNEVLLVTTAQKEKEKLVSHTYPVSDVIGPNEDFQSLIMMLEASTSGPWMNRDGEGGTMTELRTTGGLVVRQRLAVQRQVLNLLRQQREAQKRIQPSRIIDKSNRRSDKSNQVPQSGGGYFRTSMSSGTSTSNGMEPSRWR